MSKYERKYSELPKYCLAIEKDPDELLTHFILNLMSTSEWLLYLILVGLAMRNFR